MKNLFFLLVFLCFVGCSSNKQIVDEKSIDKKPIVEKKEVEIPVRVPFEKIYTSKKDSDGYLVGIANRYDFEDQAYKVWFNSRYEEYSSNKEVVNNISKHINLLTIKVFMGTWCEDSQREMPKFYKILDETKFDLNYLQLICVDRTKKHENLEKGLNIFRVPTIIFFKNSKEIGRFVEYPRESIEKDILKIVSGQPYKHSYVGRLER